MTPYEKIKTRFTTALMDGLAFVGRHRMKLGMGLGTGFVAGYFAQDMAEAMRGSTDGSLPTQQAGTTAGYADRAVACAEAERLTAVQKELAEQMRGLPPTPLGEVDPAHVADVKVRYFRAEIDASNAGVACTALSKPEDGGVER
ncbi:hypothetical protein [Hyphomicrobium sp. CS1BSMeth3]|uniref:hypothetical protein n=1 Tax=Hyphomicrobium sp. CS1BSMeth3 TaxID=1892844 RepID=UPI0011606A95|nr:hypothetical protein [Hyphomicrobium sp. CS1BSMeth3]